MRAAVAAKAVGESAGAMQRSRSQRPDFDHGGLRDLSEIALLWRRLAALDSNEAECRDL